MGEGLQAAPGFDWSLVKWGGPRDPVTESCSYCGSPLREDEDGVIALRLFSSDGHGAAFCEPCQSRWFGIEGFADPEGGA